jgi:methionyl-tRNA formyltransferase
MLLERVTLIDARETAASLHDRLATLGAAALLEALDGIAAGSLQSRAQPAEGATYASKIRKEEALLDWSKPAVEIDRLVRAFNPWPIAETRWNGQQLRVWEAMPIAVSTAASPGTVTATSAAGIEVATGDGALLLTRVQAAGRKAMSAADFLKAHRPEGAVLGQ